MLHFLQPSVRLLRWLGRNSRRLTVTLLGFAVLGAGLAMLVLPGPGVVVILLGLALLATEFAWAERALSRTADRAATATSKVTARRSGLILLGMSAVSMIAGGGTSWRQMGITLLALLTHPEQLEQVKADRSLLDDAVDESLRWNPTAPFFYRNATCDTELYGHKIAQGDIVEVGIGPANRDPSRWDNPDAFDINRPKLSNMAFGLGVHRCLGMNVAKVEMMHAIGALLDSFPNIRLDPGEPLPEIGGGFEQRGPTAVPVLLR